MSVTAWLRHHLIVGHGGQSCYTERQGRAAEHARRSGRLLTGRESYGQPEGPEIPIYSNLGEYQEG